ncbi:MAG: hypothetical protein JSU01_20855 [Bacteroidetes bacterium]|nr:hypothetical protein [Bacteroidota bacterium]
MAELDNINGFLFVDEVKHTVANGEGEDSFYYFAIAAPKPLVHHIEQDYKAAVKHLKKGFHATKAYKAKSIDTTLLTGLTDILVKYKLPLVVFRYDKHKLYQATQAFLAKLNHPEIIGREGNWEMQAFFHLIQALDKFLAIQSDKYPVPLCAFCDRGIYGQVNPIEGIDFNSPYLKRAMFTSRGKVNLLGLADHAGFLFAKTRLATHSTPNKDFQTVLQQNVFGQQLARLVAGKLFHYLEA